MGSRALGRQVWLVSSLGLLALLVTAPVASSTDPVESPYTPAGAARLLASPQGLLLSGGGETALRRIAGQLKAPARASQSGGRATSGAPIPLAPVNNQVNSPDPSGPTCATQSEAHILDIGAGKLVAGFNDSGLACTTGDYTGYAVSTDGGVTWSDKGTPPNPAGQDNFGDPVLAKDRAGNVYFSFLSSTGLGVAKMPSGSTTFGTWVDADAGTGGFADKEWLAAGPDPVVTTRDNLYLAWLDFGLFSANFRMSRSIDGGATWQALPTFTFVCNTCQGIFPVVDQSNGKIYAFWEDGLGLPGRSIRFKSSTDGGNTWSAAATAASVTDSTADSACGRESHNFTSASRAVRNSEFPSAAIAAPTSRPTTIVVVWNDGRLGNSDVFATTSSNGGATWRAPVRVNVTTAGEQFQPSVFADARGVHLQWYSGDKATNQVNLLARSFLFGSGPTAETQISAVAFPVQVTNPNSDPLITGCYWGDYNQLGADGTLTHYIWGDTRNMISGQNQPDVFAARQ